MAKADLAAGARADLRGDEETVRGFVRLNVFPRYRKKADATLQQAAWAFDKHILPSLGDMPCSQVRLHHVQKCLDQIPAERSGDTVQTVRKYLHKTLRLMARERHIPYNYLEEIEAPKVSVREPVLDARQWWNLVSATYHTHPTTFAVAFCAGGLGLCRGEILGLDPHDLKADGSLTVTDQEVYVPKKGRVNKDKLKTSQRTRQLLLPDFHRGLLRTILDAGWLEGVHPTSIRKMLARECEFLGLPVTTTHLLRKTFATELDNMGCPRGVLKGLLGHSPKDSTDGYARGGGPAGRDWLTKLLDHASTTPRGNAGVSLSCELPQEGAVL